MCVSFFLLFLILSISFLSFSLYFLIFNMIYILEWLIISVNSMNFMFVILLDWMSLMFMSFVLFISSMVIFYSEEYMSGDLNKNRFILLVVMFVLSMMMLIISPNLVSILLGWDGLGLVSYCLVIYYQNIKSFNAGMLTALSNRIGDVALLMVIAWMLNYGDWNLIFYLEIMKDDKIMQLIGMLMILAAMTKSAQIPFSSWLPAAMAAPTPVSSLVHSSTLVTAGVYLLIRFNFLNESLMLVLVFISSMTMFMSGLGANFEFDLKKIIALSTLSQLGFMMSILALGDYKLAFFHLLIHAIFKALLFMCAGNIIHNLGNCQDIRYMGGLIKQLPLTCTYLNICNLSLCGLPFMSGFYSKDLIVEFMSMNYLNIYIYMIFFISIGLTVSYSFRLVYYSLTGNYNFLSLSMMSEMSYIMLKGMSGLILFVVFSGSMFSWLIFSVPYYICLPLIMKMMTLFMISIGIWLGYELSKFKISYNSLSMKYLSFSLFLSLMWNMPVLSTLGINYYPIYFGKIYTKLFDQGWLEYYGGLNLVNSLKNLSIMQVLSLNHIKIYLMMLIFWLVFLLMIF
uniref:NADH-ubiquinone oxidoreductase chain 5 n=1 Tax=Monolepta hieroglyphica TaxID=327932 RepID=A0A891T715_9CUCU|nr:NADH dehydrogenase subunit 5 [Monolepta quadriguttata]YP_010164566.1 NADH dehydrogenase subunit 5 [Monolepta hieroglyphica]AST14985.1 NADH dehydrogenase subunit 5 [Monolepta quadriguttata]QRM91329.1 NADH dehydrogenase subunit 5 [Monolepta hieroglyphica]QUA05770.1 NADH dehydrogenase subunit 5 [Monolepta hieroglyphica]UFP05640.1 NADH dehydrogenase subunit 5 [Monolepta hieroglyphica]